MAKLIWTDPALAQLDEILSYIALDRPSAAKGVAGKIVEITDKVEMFKLLGHPIPEFPVAGYRQIWIRPCWIYYRVVEDVIIVLHVRRGESLLDVERLYEEGT